MSEPNRLGTPALINYRNLQEFAGLLLASPKATETEVRRAVSASYYGLFHRLAAEGANFFGSGGAHLSNQVARAYSHTAMLEVCRAFKRLPKTPLPSPLDRLLPPNPDTRLTKVAAAFVALQEARHAADYDVAVEFLRADGIDALSQAEFAHWMLDEVHGLPETSVFLTALLLHDRWKRRG